MSLRFFLKKKACYTSMKDFQLLTNMKLHEIDHRFDRLENDMQELKHGIATNGDALVSVIEKMDTEFAMISVQFERIDERFSDTQLLLEQMQQAIFENQEEIKKNSERIEQVHKRQQNTQELLERLIA